MIINVTAYDIQNGVKKDNRFCPVCMACIRATCDSFSITPFTITNMSKTVTRTEVTPQIVADFINKFDAGEPVEPFSFELKAELL